MDSFMQDYVNYLRDEKGLKDNTLLSYKRDIEKFITYISQKQMNLMTDVNKVVLQNYFAYLQRENVKSSTIARCIASIKSFYSYLSAVHFIKSNPALHIHGIKVEKKLPEILSDNEINLLLSQPRTADAKGCRDKAMLELLYATGIRVSELIGLNIDNINLTLAYLRCDEGGRERIIPLYADAVAAIEQYVKNARSFMVASEDEQSLFVNTSGKRLTRQGFWKIVKQYKTMANIQKDITPHTFRHSFAAHLYENGADLRSIQEMMGHSDISSTQIYAELAKNKLAQVYNKAHPKAAVKAAH